MMPDRVGASCFFREGPGSYEKLKTGFVALDWDVYIYIFIHIFVLFSYVL